jgi:allophanate hydrolase
MDPADSYSRQHAPLAPRPGPAFSFAVPRALDFFGDGENARMFEGAVAAMERIGGARVDCDFAPFGEAGGLLYGAGFIAERVADLGEFITAHEAECHPNVVKLIMGNKDRTAVEVFKGLHRLQALKRKAAGVFEDADFLLVPTSPLHATATEVEADPIALPWKFSAYTGFANILDLAAFAVPAGINPRGLPFGVQLVGPLFSETRLAPLAARFMKAVGGHTGAPG